MKFATAVLPIKNDSYVLDTSCGSGGFLLYSLDKVRRQADLLYPRHKTDVKQHDRHYKYWHDFAANNLFGIEINEQISRAAKMNMIIHDDGHTNVITSDGLLRPSEIEKFTKNLGFKYNHFNFIVTNPPFGATIRKSEKAYLGTYDFGKKEPDWLDTKGKSTIGKRENQSTEILFIEQCHNFLAEGGYLGIVLPDGILTNSSLQYVRDGIEDKYRIVAVVSMPQTAFAANGAGVKSSILFLKKHSVAHTDKLRNLKTGIQLKLKEQFNYYEQLAAWDKEKKQKLKDLDGLEYSGAISISELKKTSEYKAWKEEISATYTEKVNDLKEQLQDAYQQAKQEKLPDYPIFMAIADDIGYDATGKLTNNNELDIIEVELTRFINAIENKEL